MRKPIAISLLFAAAAIAQEPEAATFRGMVRLNRAPVSNEVLKVKLPRPVDRQLADGLKLVILESHRAPTITATISIPSTHLRDPEGLPGVAEATAAMMMLGTSTRTARQISEALADIGATLTISAGGGGGGRGGFGGGGGTGATGTISISALTDDFDAALAILSDVLLHPSFPAEEFEKWRTRQLSALEQQ
ncbi:MAG TPA: insulinase family protein, partial [Bryobacteraceae bacterium]